MRLISVFILIFNFYSLFSQSAAETHYKIAKNKISGGYHFDAIKDLNKAISLNPKYAIALVERAKAKLYIQEISEALLDINTAIKIDGTIAEAYFVRAKIYNAMKEYDKAAPDLDKAVQLNPSYDEAKAEQIFTKFYRKKEKEAFAAIDAELKKKVNKAYLYYARGVLNNVKGKYGRAIDDFAKSLAIDSTFCTFEIYYNRCIAEINIARLDEAMADISTAIRKEPGNPRGYFVRGRAQYEKGLYKDAIDDFNKMLAAYPDDAFSLYNIGMSYIKLEDYPQACTYLHKSCKLGYENGCKMTVIHCSKK